QATLWIARKRRHLRAVSEPTVFQQGIRHRLAQVQNGPDELSYREVSGERAERARAIRGLGLDRRRGCLAPGAGAAEAHLARHQVPLGLTVRTSRASPRSFSVGKETDLSGQRRAVNRGVQQRAAEPKAFLGHVDLYREKVRRHYEQIDFGKSED